MTTNARTDPESGLRFYDWKGEAYPSVTSIRRLIGMPFTLHNWALSQVIDRALTDHAQIEAMLQRPALPRERKREQNVVKEVRAHLRKAATEERDLAGDRGTRAHDAIASGLMPLSADPDIRGYLYQFYDAIRELGATILLSERQVWNLTYGYAGTLDVVLQLPDGRVIVTDYKTSKGVYIDHAVQLMAYCMAEFVGENDKVDAVATKHLLSADGMAILHLSETQWEFVEITPDTTLFQGFLGSLAFARFLHMHDNKIDGLVDHRIKGGTLVPVLQASIDAQKEAQDG